MYSPHCKHISGPVGPVVAACLPMHFCMSGGRVRIYGQPTLLVRYGLGRHQSPIGQDMHVGYPPCAWAWLTTHAQA